ncbi:MAG: 5-formyltetrahydrofolate cyclo-ligase [Pseudomonadota bacterium]
MTDKAQLRADARTRRKAAFVAVDITPATDGLLEALTGRQGPIAFYWPIRTEIDPRPAMELCAAEGQVCLPVTHGYEPLTFRVWTPDTPLERDDFGTSYPSQAVSVTPKTLVVPLLAFDRRGHRLGYGAGHYDRTLDGLRADHAITAIGFAYGAQEIVRVPEEPTDQPLDLIVTELETISPGG